MANDSETVGISHVGNVEHEMPTKEPAPTGPGDVMSLENVDRALSAKMHYVNDVSNEQRETTHEDVHTANTRRLSTQSASQATIPNYSSSMDLGKYLSSDLEIQSS